MIFVKWMDVRGHVRVRVHSHGDVQSNEYKQTNKQYKYEKRFLCKIITSSMILLHIRSKLGNLMLKPSLEPLCIIVCIIVSLYHCIIMTNRTGRDSYKDVRTSSAEMYSGLSILDDAIVCINVSM